MSAERLAKYLFLIAGSMAINFGLDPMLDLTHRAVLVLGVVLISTVAGKL